MLIFAHDMQIQVAHALHKQGCRLISYTANIRLVTIAACYNCPRSPLVHCVFDDKEKKMKALAANDRSPAAPTIMQNYMRRGC